MSHRNCVESLMRIHRGMGKGCKKWCGKSGIPLHFEPGSSGLPALKFSLTISQRHERVGERIWFCYCLHVQHKQDIYLAHSRT